MLFKTHPNSILVLTFAELCDRMCFYGILAILVLFLPGHFHQSNAITLACFGIYTTLGFATPVIGGLIADSFLGNAKSVIIGQCLLVAGCFIASIDHLSAFFLGLSIVVIGIGFLKSPVTSQLGLYYPDGDPRKKAAYTLFYIGMNVGAMLGPVIFGFLYVGDTYAHGLQAVGAITILSIVAYVVTYLKNNLPEEPNLRRLIPATLATNTVFLLAILAAIWGIFQLYIAAEHFKEALIPFGVVILLILLGVTLNEKGQSRKNMILLMTLTSLSVFYFACAKQTESTVLIFIQNEVDRYLFGYDVPAANFPAFKPFFIVLFALCAAPLWQAYCKHHKQPSAILLVAAGLAFAAGGFGVFSLAAKLTMGPHNDMVLTLLMVGYFLVGIGEVCIMPTVTSAVSDLAPKRIQSTMMGVWCLSLSFSSYLSAILAESIVHQSKSIDPHMMCKLIS